MTSPTDLLHAHVRRLADLSGAIAVSVYVPASGEDRSDAILVHEGQADAVPELHDLQSAERLRKNGVAASGPVPNRGSSREFPSAAPDCGLVRMGEGSAVVGKSADGESSSDRKRGRRASDQNVGDGTADPARAIWIGFRFPSPRTSVAPASPDSYDRDDGWSWHLSMTAAIGRHVQQVREILNDRVTGLPSRLEFQTRLDFAVHAARQSRGALTLLMVSPDEFAVVNDSHGPKKADQALRDVGLALRLRLRQSDIVARYGGAVFMVLLADTGEDSGVHTANEVLEQLNGNGYLEGSLCLTFSIGAATVVPAEDAHCQPLDLVRRADQALKLARWCGGGCVRSWDPAFDAERVGVVDRLSGVFTGNMSKDYRNMKLLSETISAIAGSTDFDELASQVVSRLQSTLKADGVGLFDWPTGRESRLIRGRSRVSSNHGGTKTVDEFAPDPHLGQLLEDARRDGRALESVLDEQQDGVAYVVPLIAGEACLGCLVLKGQTNRIELDSSDLFFLQALASQLALALDRARLAQVEKDWQEKERQRLRSEVDELRRVLPQAELVCRSDKMKSLMDTARRVAATDATILICGESGTGKELLSRTIHRLSTRREGPFVVVDCAAIPATLIESELFGHEKGAYTGAHHSKIGRLAEADGGTVILDEVGELPPEIQSTLLRFVQEKQIQPVGGNKIREVDVRVVAATNRDLEQEVRNGRFREDLFHRLNVISLEIPPLRARREDVLPLTEQFLRQFSIEYKKGTLCRLDAEAEHRVLGYSWPGNVRQLRNRIMQAVILAEDAEITAAQLDLSDEQDESEVDPEVARPSVDDTRVAPAGDLAGTPSSGEPLHSTANAWPELSAALRAIVEVNLESGSSRSFPLGRWLAEDLILTAFEASGQVARRGAEILGISESTFRRRLRKAANLRDVGLGDRPEFWDGIRPWLIAALQDGNPGRRDLLRAARDVLLAIVVSRIPDRVSAAAALMGVTEPTFRRWARDFEANRDGDDGSAGSVYPESA